MHNKRILTGLMIASMTAGCSALPNVGDRDNPPAYVNVVSTEEIRIRLIPQDAGAQQTNEHPAAFEPAQLEALLSSLRIENEDGRASTLTSPSRIRQLSASLSKAFVRAGPRQDVAFVVFRRVAQGQFAGSARHVTTGRAFYRGDTLHIIFGEFDDRFSEFRDMSINEFEYGSRAEPRQVGVQRLVAGESWHWHGERRDWIELEATPEAIEAARAAAPRVIESSASTAAQPLEYGPAAAGKSETGTAEPASEAPAAVESSASMTAEPAPAAPAPRDAEWSRIEERLTRLKRLREQNLISADDYEQKKDALLERLP